MTNRERKIDNKRSSIRVGIKKLTSIVKGDNGDYELVQGDDKAKTATINIVDVSMGGLCIESKSNIKSGVSLDLKIPKVENLDSTTVACNVARSVFREDPMFYKHVGPAGQDKSYYAIGLKFKTPNTEYLKQLYKLAVSHKI